jgi:hypothetical protein
MRSEKAKERFQSVLKFGSERLCIASDFGSELLSLSDWKGGQEGIRYPYWRLSTASWQLLFGKCQPVGDIWWSQALIEVTSVVLVSILVWTSKWRSSVVVLVVCWLTVDVRKRSGQFIENFIVQRRCFCEWEYYLFRWTCESTVPMLWFDFVYSQLLSPLSSELY